MSRPSTDALNALLGGEVGQIRLGQPRCVSIADFGGAQLETLAFRLNSGDTIPGVFLRQPKPGPAILYCHAHGAAYHIGMAEFAEGRPALTGPFAPDLAAAGYSVLCLEMPCFGARAEPTEVPLSKAHHWQGTTLFGRMLAEQVAGLEFLLSQPQVDPDRVGVMGISMGGTLAWWLAALEPRLGAAVSMCSFADMARLIDTGAHDIHGPYMTVPGLLKHASTGQVSGLAAPRPLLHCIGLTDPGTPPDAVKVAREDVESAYRALGALDALEFHITTDLGHRESHDMRRKVLDFLARSL